MSDEPNRKMEDLLKAFAKKRQQDAGDPDMHPATRRMLQGEVRRTFGPSATSSAGKTSGWSLFWPRFALAAAACILVLAVIFVTQKSPEPEFDVATAPARQTALKDKVDALPSNTRSEAAVVAESSPVEADVSLQSVEVKTPASVAQSRRDSAEGQPEASLAGALHSKEAVAKAPAAATGRALSGGATPAATIAAPQTGGLYFQSIPGTGIAARKAQRSPSTQLLSRFEVKADERGLRVVDFDGSVYEGRLVSVTAAQSADRLGISQGEQKQTEATTGAKAELAAIPQTFRFEVSGTNRSLNQPVRFEGIFSTFAATASAADESGVNTSTEADRSQAMPTYRINGTLFVNKTNTVPINAIRAQP